MEPQRGEPLTTVVQPMSPSPSAAGPLNARQLSQGWQSFNGSSMTPRPLFDTSFTGAGGTPGLHRANSTSVAVGNEAGITMLTQQNKALQGLLNRAEENLARAQDRERQLRAELDSIDRVGGGGVDALRRENQALRERLESSGSPGKADSLVKENEALREQVRSVNAFSQEQQELTKKLQASLSDAMRMQEGGGGRGHEDIAGKLASAERELARLVKELESAREYEARAREECEEVLREKAAMRGHISGLEDAAAEREKSISMLKWTVGDLTRQLDAASGDMDLAAQIQSRHAGDGERAHELLEGLKAELRDSQAAQASAREEIRAMDEVVQRLRAETVPESEAAALRRAAAEHAKVADAKVAEACARADDADRELAAAVALGKKVDAQLAEVTGMWQQTALENGELRSKADQLDECKHRSEGLQTRVDELVGQVSELVPFKEGYQLIEALCKELETDAASSKKACDFAKVRADVADAKVRTAQAEALAAQQRLDDALGSMCSGEALQREREAAARARREGGLERAALKQQLAEATAALMDMRKRTADVRRVRVEVLEEVAKELRDADSDLDKVRGGGEAYIAEFTASRDAAAAAASTSTPVVSRGSGVIARAGLSEGIAALHEQQHKQVANEIRHLEAAVRSTEACMETTASAVKAYVALKGVGPAGADKSLDVRKVGWEGMGGGGAAAVGGRDAKDRSPGRGNAVGGHADNRPDLGGGVAGEGRGGRGSVGGGRAPAPLRGLFQALEGGDEDDTMSVTELERVIYASSPPSRGVVGGGRSGGGGLEEEVEALKRQLLMLRTSSVPMADYKRAIQVLHAEREKERESERQRERLTEALRRAQNDAEQVMKSAVEGIVGRGAAGSVGGGLESLVGELKSMGDELGRLNRELLERGRERDDARRGHLEDHAKLVACEGELSRCGAELRRCNEDREKLKVAVKAATDAIRNVAEQRCAKVDALEQQIMVGQREREALYARLTETEESLAKAVEAGGRLRDAAMGEVQSHEKEKDMLRGLAAQLQAGTVPVSRLEELENRRAIENLEGRRELHEKSSQIARLEAELGKKEDEIASLRSELEELTAAMEVAREMYEQAQQPLREQSTGPPRRASGQYHRHVVAEASPDMRRTASAGAASVAAAAANAPSGGGFAAMGGSMKVGNSGGGGSFKGGLLAERARRMASGGSSGPPPAATAAAAAKSLDDSLPSFDDTTLGDVTADVSVVKADATPSRGRQQNNSSSHNTTRESNAEAQDEDEYVRRSALKNKWWKNKGLRPPSSSGSRPGAQT